MISPSIRIAWDLDRAPAVSQSIDGGFGEALRMAPEKKEGNPLCDLCRPNELPESLVESGITVLPCTFVPEAVHYQTNYLAGEGLEPTTFGL